MTTETPVADLSPSLGVGSDVERLFDNVQAEVPAVFLPQIKMALWNTVEHFYINSTLHREHVHFRMGPGVRTISFNPFDAYSTVVWILNWRGLHRGRVEPPATLIDLATTSPETTRDGEAVLALRPISYDSFTAQTKDGCGPAYQELWSTWFDTILSGVLFRLYVQPAKPWSSPQLAKYHGSNYRRGVAMARDVARRGHSIGAPMRFPYFAGGSQGGAVGGSTSS